MMSEISPHMRKKLMDLVAFLIELAGGGGVVETKQEIHVPNDTIVISKVLYDPTIVVTELTQSSWVFKDNDAVMKAFNPDHKIGWKP